MSADTRKQLQSCFFFCVFGQKQQCLTEYMTK
nr:MAG TPA: hypothetical protein [Caudoviricetes sp.]